MGAPKSNGISCPPEVPMPPPRHDLSPKIVLNNSSGSIDDRKFQAPPEKSPNGFCPPPPSLPNASYCRNSKKKLK